MGAFLSLVALYLAAVAARTSDELLEIDHLVSNRSGLTQAAFDFAQAREACGLHPAHGQLK